MAEEKLYKIMEQNSTGWNLHSNDAQNLTKNDAEKIINRLLELGANPSDIKAVFQDDTRYDNRLPLT